jgi:hypothetical protein
MVKVRVLPHELDGTNDAIQIYTLGKMTHPQAGKVVEISEDEWMSQNVQRLVRKKKIERIDAADNPQIDSSGR